MTKRYLTYLPIVCALILSVSCGGGGAAGDGGDGGGVTGTSVTIESGEFQDASSSLSATTLGINGGTISAAGGDIQGFAIQSAAAATDEDVSFSVSYAEVTGISGLPEGSNAASHLIRVEAAGTSDGWNEYRMFDSEVAVTLPYIGSSVSDGQRVAVFAVNPNGTIDDHGYAQIDTDNNRITFLTRSFANTAPTSPLEPSISAQVAAGGSKGVGVQKGASDIFWDAYALNTPSRVFQTYIVIAYTVSNGSTIDTGFRPGTDGFYIPNEGSIATVDGNCWGMTTFARFYYRYMGQESDAYGLYNQFRDADNTARWQDDSTAIELATRAQMAEAALIEEHAYEELDFQNPETVSQQEVAYSWLGAMQTTGMPVIAGVYRRDSSSNTLDGAHALLIYRAVVDDSGNITFYVYDPNYPNEEKSFTYTAGSGLAAYETGEKASASTKRYNYYKHVSFMVFVTDDEFTDILLGAFNDYQGESIFPTVTISTITGKNNSENVMANGCTVPETDQHCYETSDSSVTITGTVSGTQGMMQNVTLLSAYLGSGSRYGDALSASDDGTGTYVANFSVNIPVPQGAYNELAIIASKFGWEGWAGYVGDVIRSTADVSPLTVTLDWDQDGTDVDLYVKEPDFSVSVSGGSTLSYTGDTVYWSNRKGQSSTNPYLDFDNTSGLGPEHYIAPQGSSTLATNGSTENPNGLFGSYTVKVHYYRGSVPITYNLSWEYCPLSNASLCSSSSMISGGASGTLSSAGGASNCCNIDNTGSDWSEAYTITLTSAASEDVPDVNEVMLE